MKLNVDLPAEWSVQTNEEGKRLVVVREGAVVMEIETLIPIPEEAREWIEEVMGENVPPDCKLGELDELETKNDLTWPMEIVAVQVIGPDGKVVEDRLGAFYKFNEWGGQALVRSRDPRALEAVRGKLLAILRAGRPQWTSPTVIASIAELWT